MKVEIDGNEIRIKGEICGETRHLYIYCNKINGEDYYSISVVKDGFQIGCGPSYYMNSNHVIQLHEGNKRFID